MDFSLVMDSNSLNYSWHYNPTRQLSNVFSLEQYLDLLPGHNVAQFSRSKLRVLRGFSYKFKTLESPGNSTQYLLMNVVDLPSLSTKSHLPLASTG